MTRKQHLTPRRFLSAEKVERIRAAERAWYHRNKAAKSSEELEEERIRKREYDRAYHARLSESEKLRRKARQAEAERLRRAKRTPEQRNALAKKQRDVFWGRSTEEQARIRQVAAAKKAEKRRQDVNYRVYTCLQARVHDLLRGMKSARTLELVGEDYMTALTARLKPGMSWENYGPEWHLDHVVPCRWFDLTRPEHQRACFHHSNVNPEFAKANISKSNRVSRRAFDEVMARCPAEHKAVFEEIIWKIRRKEYPERMLRRVHGHV